MPATDNLATHADSGRGTALIPRQLPASPPHFTNRASELARLDSARSPGGRTPRLIVITGPSGVGKSALAVHWLDSVLDHYPDGALYAAMTTSTRQPAAAEDVLGGFLRALGIPPSIVPATLAEREALFRTVTADLSIAMLLDDAATAEQVTPLLPATSGSVVVATSCRPLAGLIPAGATVVAVPPVAPDAAAEIVTRHAGPARLAADPPISRMLVDRCQGLPLALTIVAALMVLRPQRPLAELLADLDDGDHGGHEGRGTRALDMLSLSPTVAVRATFDLSYRGLSGPAARGYHAIGLHAGVLVSDELVAAACAMNRSRAIRVVDELVDAHILEETSARRVYRCHDLLRAHAYDTASAAMTGHERTEMRLAELEWHLFAAQAASRLVMPARELVEYEFTQPYDRPGDLTDHATALEWLERHRHDLAAVMQAAVDNGAYRLASTLADALQPLFIIHKHAGATEVNDLALAAALTLGEWAAEARARRTLARAHLRRGELDEAHRHATLLMDTASRHSDSRVRASGLKILGGLHARRGDHGAAARCFADAVDILRGCGRSRAVALALTELGRALTDNGQVDHAAAALIEALDLLSHLDQPDPYNIARSTRLLARAHRQRGEDGDYAIASDLLNKAIHTLEELGADDELAAAHDELAALASARGDKSLAQRSTAEAARIRRSGA